MDSTGNEPLDRDGRGKRDRPAALGRGEDGYRWLVENTTETVWRFDLEEPVPVDLPADEQIDRFYRHGFLGECNEAMARLYGYACAADILGARLGAMLDPGVPQNLDYLRAFIASGYHLLDAESTETDREGREKYVLNNLVGIVEEGRLLGAWGTSRDITDRRRAEVAVRESRDLLRVILEGVDEAVAALDRSGRMVFANTAAARSLRFDSPEALMAAGPAGTLRAFDVFDADGKPLAREDLPGTLALLDGREHRQEAQARLKATGETTWWLIKAVPIPAEPDDPDRRPRLVVSFFQDMTEAKRAELELRQSREQLAVILANVADAIVVHDGWGRVVYANEAAARLLDFPSGEAVVEAANRPEARAEERRMEILDEAGRPVPAERVPYRRALSGEEAGPEHLRLRRAAGAEERRVVAQARRVRDAEGRLRMVITIMQDVTELSRAEEQFRQAQKMEAVGRLAGGVAHDFNNLLTAINGYSDLLLALLEKEDARRAHVEEIRKAGERAANLTNQLLAYSRRQMLAPRLIRPNAVVAGIEPMLRRLIGEDIRLEVDLHPGAGDFRADPGQVEQVILNLVVNARDAMPGGGVLALRTCPIRLGPGRPAPDPALAPGDYVALEVADTGMGMEPEVKARLFEPFFTTKAAGKGTGLGLSTAYGIVKQSGGAIEVESEPGRGSTFRVWFPVAAEGDLAASPQAGERAVRGGNETVLVVEDEDSVRRLLTGILRGLGYQVLEARDGEEALDLARRHHGPLDVLLTDVVMARMGGRELAERLRPQRPDLRTVYMSGYTDDAVGRAGVLSDGGNFLQKPFTPDSLARKVRQVLETPSPVGRRVG